MEPLEKLRKLVWDTEKAVFTDEDLEEYFSDAGQDVYAAAALCLNIVRANPEKLRSFAVFTYEDLDKAIKMYQRLAAGSMQTADSRKTYPR